MTSWINRLEQRFGRFAIPQITLYIVVGQAAAYVYLMLKPEFYDRIAFSPELVKAGEVWRLITFVFTPPNSHWALIAFALYFIFLMGNALENHWGTFRYNLFLLFGYILTVAAAFITPGTVGSNVFIGGSIFLAFAYLYPDFVIYIYFILPVKVRWIAIITWIGYAFAFFTGGLSTKLAIGASVGNYMLFFAKDIVLDIKLGRRRMQNQAQRAKAESGLDEPRHKCIACGRDSTQFPQLDFRYCSQCAGDCCYCGDHIRDHVHKT